MQIPINKDLEEAYQDEAFRGFTWREAISIGIAVALIAGITAFARIKYQISPDVGIFLAIPFAVPIVLAGFKKYQGLTVWAYLREIFYEHQTKVLTYEAEELPKDSYHEFTMESHNKRRKR